MTPIRDTDAGTMKVKKILQIPDGLCALCILRVGQTLPVHEGHAIILVAQVPHPGRLVDDTVHGAVILLHSIRLGGATCGNDTIDAVDAQGEYDGGSVGHVDVAPLIPLKGEVWAVRDTPLGSFLQYTTMEIWIGHVDTWNKTSNTNSSEMAEEDRNIYVSKLRSYDLLRHSVGSDT